MKEIALYMCVTDELILNPKDPENPEAKWVDPSNVEQYLTHPKDREFYEEVKTEVTGIAAIDRNDLKEALDTMEFNSKQAFRHPTKQEEFQSQGMYEYDPNNFEETRNYYEYYGYHYTLPLWTLQQLQYNIAAESADRRLATSGEQSSMEFSVD